VRQLRRKGINTAKRVQIFHPGQPHNAIPIYARKPENYYYAATLRERHAMIDKAAETSQLFVGIARST
jgi:hypothetical protein